MTQINKYLKYPQVELDNMIKSQKGIVSAATPDKEDLAKQTLKLMEEAMSAKVNASDEHLALPFEVQVAKRYQATYDSAVRRDKEFTMTFAHLKRLMKQKKCAYTGVVFSQDPQMGMTIDRIDSEEGYTDKNTVAVTYFANAAKNHLLENETSHVFMGLEMLKAFVDNVSKLNNR